MKKVLCTILMLALLASMGAMAEAAAFTPGTYSATARGNNGPITVEVVMTETGIESIEVTECSETRGIGTTAIEMLTSEMIERQTVDVDMISSATMTSAAMKLAVKDCVSQAGDVSALANLPAAEKEQYGDSEADFVVIGAGGAGIAAAIAAGKAGLNVVLLEKQDIIGGSTTMVGVGVNGGGTKLQKELTAEDFYQHLAETGNLTAKDGGEAEMSEEYTRAFADNASRAVDWLIDLGMPIHALEDGSGNASSHQLDSMDNGKFGEVMMGLLSQELDKAENVDLRVANKATEILFEDGAVCGVKVEGDNGAYTIATKNVLIATGGYSANTAMFEEYAPDLVGLNVSMPVSSMGEGIEMALAAGGRVSDMDDLMMRQLTVGYREIGGATYAQNTMASGEILVNKEGARFVDEGTGKGALIAAISAQTDKSCYIIASQEMLDNNAQLKDLNKRGLLKQADTIEDLAKALSLDAGALQATVDGYNIMVAAANDTDFGREEMPYDLVNGPFYGVEARASRHYCNGGVVTNGKAEVVNDANEPIEGLYAAGEVTFHSAHPASNALTFGMVAGEQVAAKLGK